MFKLDLEKVGESESEVSQSCPTLRDPMDCSLSGSSEYWSGLPFPSPGDLPDPGIEPRSPSLRAETLPSELPGKSKVEEPGIKLPASAG